MQQLLRKTKSRIVALRCRVLLLLHFGHTAAEVAERAACMRAAVYRTVCRFEGLVEQAIHDQRLFREAVTMTPKVQERMLGYLDSVPNDYDWDRANWTPELLAHQLAVDTQVELSCS